MLVISLLIKTTIEVTDYLWIAGGGHVEITAHAFVSILPYVLLITQGGHQIFVDV